MKLGKKKQEEIEEKQETPDEELIAYLGIQGFQVPEGSHKLKVTLLIRLFLTLGFFKMTLKAASST